MLQWKFLRNAISQVAYLLTDKGIKRVSHDSTASNETGQLLITSKSAPGRTTLIPHAYHQLLLWGVKEQEHEA
jgi:hypothetical protein